MNQRIYKITLAALVGFISSASLAKFPPEPGYDGSAFGVAMDWDVAREALGVTSDFKLAQVVVENPLRTKLVDALRLALYGIIPNCDGDSFVPKCVYLIMKDRFTTRQLRFKLVTPGAPLEGDLRNEFVNALILATGAVPPPAPRESLPDGAVIVLISNAYAGKFLEDPNFRFKVDSPFQGSSFFADMFSWVVLETELASRLNKGTASDMDWEDLYDSLKDSTTKNSPPPGFIKCEGSGSYTTGSC